MSQFIALKLEKVKCPLRHLPNQAICPSALYSIPKDLIEYCCFVGTRHAKTKLMTFASTQTIPDSSDPHLMYAAREASSVLFEEIK